MDQLLDDLISEINSHVDKPDYLRRVNEMQFVSGRESKPEIADPDAIIILTDRSREF